MTPRGLHHVYEPDDNTPGWSRFPVGVKPDDFDDRYNLYIPGDLCWSIPHDGKTNDKDPAKHDLSRQQNDKVAGVPIDNIPVDKPDALASTPRGRQRCEGPDDTTGASTPPGLHHGRSHAC